MSHFSPTHPHHTSISLSISSQKTPKIKLQTSQTSPKSSKMESPTTRSRKPNFIIEENTGLALITHNNKTDNNKTNGYVVDYQNHMMRRRNSLRNISSLSVTSTTIISPSSSSCAVGFSPRSGRVMDRRFEEVHTPYFLDSCALCRKPLGGNRDIFMYRGDTPFCSEECRQEQIEIDEVKEKNWKSKLVRNKKDAQKSSSSKPQTYAFRPGTVAAA